MPLDVPAMLESVTRTRRAVVVHDAVRFAGPGAEIAATLQEELWSTLAAPVDRVGARFVPNPAAPVLESADLPERRADRGRRAQDPRTDRSRKPCLTSPSASRASASPCRRRRWSRSSSRTASRCHEGDPLFTIGTDKVETEVPAVASGTVFWTGEVDTTYDIAAEIGVIRTSD